MARRKSIHIKGMEHGAPIPNGVVIGNMIFSSAISGKDAKTGEESQDGRTGGERVHDLAPDPRSLLRARPGTRALIPTARSGGEKDHLFAHGS